MAATTTYAYLNDNSVDTIVHTDDTTPTPAVISDYSYAYGADGDMTQMVTPDETIDFTLDLSGQVTDVDHSVETDEDYDYDDNGNRTNTGYTTSTGNRMLTDGTYTYQYDANGNRTLRYVDGNTNGELDTGDTDISVYKWDYRNRLVKVLDYAVPGDVNDDETLDNSSQIVEYVYDAFNNRISKIVDADGDGAADSPVRTNFALLDGEVYLEFNGSDLSYRYMPGASIDMNLAIEEVSGGEVRWALPDHQGTVRDVIKVINGVGTVQNHIQYSSFGHITSQSDDTVAYRFTYTGRELDAETGLYYYRARYYDAENGRFISEDPIAFEAGDANLYRYVGNNPGNGTDPKGLKPPSSTFFTPLDANGRALAPMSTGVQPVTQENSVSNCHAVRREMRRLSMLRGGGGDDGMALYDNVVRWLDAAGAWLSDGGDIIADAWSDAVGTAGEYYENAKRNLDGSPFDQFASRISERAVEDWDAARAYTWSDLGDDIIENWNAARAYTWSDLGDDIEKFKTKFKTDPGGTAADITYDTGKVILIYKGAGKCLDVCKKVRGLKGPSIAPKSVKTPYGPAVQEQSAAALRVRSQIQQGGTVYKGGVLGRSETGASQFLATESPLNPGYAGRYGIPPQNAQFDFIMGGRVRPGAPVITRSAPGIPPNLGGGIEGVINSGDFMIDWFHMP